MSLKDIFSHAVNKAQQKKFCHKKLIKLVENAFDKSKLEEFLEVFIDMLYNCYCSGMSADKDPYVARALEFLAKIAINITLQCVHPMVITDSNGTASQVYDITLDPFFINVLKSSLKFACVEKKDVRFNTCYFIMTLLQNIGNNVEMDYSVCNIILDSLLELLHDPKANVRIQAIKALVRLQEPSSGECMVMKSFWILCTDPNSEVRKAVINNIAPHPQSFAKLKMRLTDSDLGVRLAAYAKFADVNPKLFLKITDRNIILTTGLADSNKKIKQLLVEKLLPKWLSYYEGNYLLFFRALRLDADENDINNFEKLCTELLEIFLERNSLNDIIKYLPVDKETQLIPIENLRLECVFYWSNVISYLRKTEDEEENLKKILPELTPFSNFIERIIKEKFSVTMEEWENLEFQNVLYQLFEISLGYDISDEVGRKTLYALILQILTTNKFQQKVINKMLRVASQLNSDVGSLTIDLCQVISEIREPLIDEVPSEDKLRKQNFEITQLKVKIHQLEINEEEALKKKDFQHAHIVQNEINECQRKLENLKSTFTGSEKVRVSKDDPETLCRCLDILIGLLKIPTITAMSPALQSCRDEFLMPLLSNNISEVHWRFILSLGLFSLMDKDLAFQHANFLCLPIATYRAIPNYDKIALKTSVACVTDLICMFGVKVIGMQENPQSELNLDYNPITSRRKLYSEDLNEPEIMNKDDITIEFIIDIIVDMLDDENEGVRLTASTSIYKLIAHDFPINSELICRLILKWYNPETEKKDARLHQQLGSIIECFNNCTKGAKKIVQKAVVPIISSIVNASGTSPLLEIDIENVLRLLAAFTSVANDNGPENIHNEIATDLLERISNKPNDACTPYLVKLLTYLELNFDDVEKCEQLIASVEFSAPDIVDKVPQKNLLKFCDKLKAGLKRGTAAETEEDKGEKQLENGSANHVTNGNTEDRSSLTAVNEESNNDVQEQDEVTDISAEAPKHTTRRNNGNHSTSTKELVKNTALNCEKKHEENNKSEKDSDPNSQGNSSNSESDLEKDCVETQSTRSGTTFSVKGAKKANKGKGNHQEISKGNRKNKETIRKANNKSQIIPGASSSSDESEEPINDDSTCVKCDYTSEKNMDTRKTANGKIQIISQVTLKESHNSENEKASSQCSIRTRSNKTKTKTNEFISVDLSKRNQKKHQRPSNNGSTSTYAKPDNERSSPSKQSLRTPSFPSKFNDYVTLKSVKQNIIAKAQVEKRTAQTPLSATVNRKSKRLSKDPAFKATPKKSTNSAESPVSTPFEKQNTNTPLSVTRRSFKRFTRTSTKLSEIIQKKKPPPTLSVRKSLRKRLSTTLNSSSRNNSNKIRRLKKSPEKKSKTKITGSPSTLSEPEENGEVTSRDKTQPNHILRRTLRNKNHLQTHSDDDLNNKYSEKIEVSVSKRILRNQKIEDKLIVTNKRKIRNNSEKKSDEVKLKQKIETSQKSENNKSSPKSAQNSERHGSKQKKDILPTKEKRKDKMVVKKQSDSGSSRDVNNRVLKNLNSALNEIDNVSKSRRSSRIGKSERKMLLKNNQNKKTKETHSQLETTSSPTLTRTRLSERLNESKTTSRKKLEFSSDSDETILKTFLQGDEEFQILEDISIEDVNSLSNISGDSKKENLSIDVSSSSSSSRRSTRRKRNRQDDTTSESESLPRKKMMWTKYKKNLQKVGQ